MDKEINYKQLLEKYVQYITDVECTDYISIHDNRYVSDVSFTKEEWQELTNISKNK